MELTCEQVSKTFHRKKAVDHVSFSIRQGVHALLGANGSGKTTLIRMLAGLLPPSEGSICFDQISIAKQYDTYCASLGYMPQHFGFYPNYTVEEFLSYMGLLKRMPKTLLQQRIDELCTQLNLSAQRKQKMKHLSGGTLRRVGIAQALLTKPSLLLLDEPTASCIYTQKGNKKIRKPQAANQTALIFDRRAAARLLSINSIRRLCWS